MEPENNACKYSDYKNYPYSMKLRNKDRNYSSYNSIKKPIDD